MLAPVYKRLSTVDSTTGYRKREAQTTELWKERAQRTVSFFQDELFPFADIVALQEYWLDDRYLNIFQPAFQQYQYQLFILQRSGRKLDAVALLVKQEKFEVLAAENIYLCALADRVALLLWLRHRVTNKDVLIANTHLSFPHNALEKMNQMKQIKNLTSTMDRFAKEHHLSKVTCMIVGDFNVESNSPVCDHLRLNGYHSCFEVMPPVDTSKQHEVTQTNSFATTTSTTTSSSKEVTPKVSFVSHRNHQAEEVGVDHIFIRPETMSALHIGLPATEDQDKDGETTSQTVPEKSLKSQKMHEKLFVESCHVLPSDLCWSHWNDKFTISDHRPVGSTIVFATKKKPL